MDAFKWAKVLKRPLRLKTHRHWWCSIRLESCASHQKHSCQRRLSIGSHHFWRTIGSMVIRRNMSQLWKEKHWGDLTSRKDNTAWAITFFLRTRQVLGHFGEAVIDGATMMISRLRLNPCLLLPRDSWTIYLNPYTTTAWLIHANSPVENDC